MKTTEDLELRPEIQLNALQRLATAKLSYDEIHTSPQIAGGSQLSQGDILSHFVAQQFGSACAPTGVSDL